MPTHPFSQDLVRRLQAAEHVAVLTGAGISAESGIPTFRDLNGLWERYKPEELASVAGFERNPLLVQRWYLERQRLAMEKQPNPGHYALVDLERAMPAFTLITQNVDDLHHRAGSRRIVELHGNLMRSYCMGCGQEADDDDLAPLAVGRPALCAACGGYIRPGVVWFGEQLPEGEIERAFVAAQQADVFLSVGTSSVVYPAADIPLLAREGGAYVAEINIEASAIAGHLDEVVLGRAGAVLPALVEAVASAPAEPYALGEGRG
jgi:NAD-dependent deacetylase